MSCEVFLKTIQGGKSVEVLLGTSAENISSFSDVSKLLAKLSEEELSQLLDSLPSLDQIEELDIEDITENTIGIYTINSVINSIDSKNNKNLANFLDIPSDSKKNSSVIIAVGKFGQRSTVKNGKIFLNLNHTYGDSAKVLALLEATMYLKGDSKEKVDEILNMLTSLEISNEKKKDIIRPYLKDSEYTSKFADQIITLFSRSSFKSLNTPEYDNLERLSIANFNRIYPRTSYKELRNFNYTPVKLEPIASLRPGDLVKLNFKDQGSIKSIYEPFYDFTFNDSNNIVIRTISSNGFINTRTISSSLIETRRLNNTKIHKSKVSNPNTVIKTTGNRFAGKYFDYINLLKVYGGKVIIEGTSGDETHDVTGITGSIIHTNTANIPIENIKEISIKVKDTLEVFTQEKLDAEISKNQNTYVKAPIGYYNITPGTKIVIEHNGELREGLLITVGEVSGFRYPQVVIQKGDKYETIILENIGLIKAIELNEEDTINVQDRSEISETLKKFYTGNIVEKLLASKKGGLLETSHSIELFNSTTNLTKGDIINIGTSDNPVFQKIIEVKKDTILVSQDYENNLSVIAYTKKYFLTIAKEKLIFSKKAINSTLAKTQITKSKFEVGTEKEIPNSDQTDLTSLKKYESVEIKGIFKRKNGDIYIKDSKDSQEDVDYKEDFIKEMNVRYNRNIGPRTPLFIYKTSQEGGDKYIHDNANTNRVDTSKLDFKTIRENAVIGTLVFIEDMEHKKTNIKPYIISNKTSEGLVLTSFHYTNNPRSNKEREFNYVISETVEVLEKDLNNGLQISSIFMPKWAIKNTANLINLSDKIKSSKFSNYRQSDSFEMVYALSNFMKDKYGVTIEYVTSDVMNKIAPGSFAIVYEGKILLNIDSANISDPVHELLHMVLMTLKSSDPQTYYSLVNLVALHPMFKEISKDYKGEIHTELLEETFVNFFSRAFRNKLMIQGVFTEESFNSSINKAVEDLLQLTVSLGNRNTFDIMERPIEEVLTEFGSKLIEGINVIDKGSVEKMLTHTGVIKQLINEGNLKEEC